MRALLLLPLFLVGCAGLTNDRFDPVEASRYSDIASLANRAVDRCDDKLTSLNNAIELRAQSSMAAAYSRVKRENERVATAGNVPLVLSNEMVTRYLNTNPSAAYCKVKLAEIATAAEQVARSIGKKEQ
jgi:hypothetical protein